MPTTCSAIRLSQCPWIRRLHAVLCGTLGIVGVPRCLGDRALPTFQVGSLPSASVSLSCALHPQSQGELGCLRPSVKGYHSCRAFASAVPPRFQSLIYPPARVADCDLILQPTLH